MMIAFTKYQGTGNDFILLDNRKGSYRALSNADIARLCNRKTGIGADGLILLNTCDGYDFQMIYHNADGGEGSLCGNGSRCTVKFAHQLGIVRERYHFLATDGPHEALLDPSGIVSVHMQDVKEISTYQNDWLLDTGSPHLVTFSHPVEQLNVYDKGRSIRYSERFSQQGININFAERRQPDCLFVRTYERGVENETLSCGTGVTAAALACHPNEKGHFEIIVDTLGGRLSVRYDNLGHQQFTNIWLSGPAERVFDGTLML